MFARKRIAMGLMVLVATASLALGQPPAGPGPDLSPDQKTRLRSVMDDARRDVRSLHERLDAARKDLSVELGKYDLNNRRIQDIAHQINDLQNEMLQRHIRTQRELRKIVNPAQFDQIKRFMGPFDGRNRPWGGRNRPGPRKDH
jgi:uncharacterized membrane protein